MRSAALPRFSSKIPGFVLFSILTLQREFDGAMQLSGQPFANVRSWKPCQLGLTDQRDLKVSLQY